MGLVGITVLSWMVVRVIWTLLTWAVLLVWLILRGVWFLVITLPVRAIRRRRRRTEYDRLIDDLVQERVANDARRIDRPAA